jgi:hypothetical protein
MNSERRLYNIWRNIVRRCTNPNASGWKYYGALGIQVCHEWSDFRVFLKNMEEGYQPGLHLHRKDINAGYSPDNCFWGTHRKQIRKRKITVTLDTPRGRMCLEEAAQVFDIPYNTLYARMNKSLDPDYLFSARKHSSSRGHTVLRKDECRDYKTRKAGRAS